MYGISPYVPNILLIMNSSVSGKRMLYLLKSLEQCASQKWDGYMTNKISQCKNSVAICILLQGSRGDISRFHLLLVIMLSCVKQTRMIIGRKFFVDCYLQECSK